MYRVKGLHEAFIKNCPSVLNRRDQAKIKLLHGRNRDNFDFKEYIYQCKAYVDCKSYHKYEESDFNLSSMKLPKRFIFSYNIPSLDIRALSSSNIKFNTPFYNGFSSGLSLFNYVFDVSDDNSRSVYEDLVSEMDKFIRESISCGELLYSGDNLQVYYTNRVKPISSSSRFDVGLILGVSNNEVIFALALDTDVYTRHLELSKDSSERLLNFSNVEATNVNDVICIKFLWNNGEGVKCYLNRLYGVSHLVKSKFESKIDRGGISFTI